MSIPACEHEHDDAERRLEALRAAIETVTCAPDPPEVAGQAAAVLALAARYERYLSTGETSAAGLGPVARVIKLGGAFGRPGDDQHHHD